MSNNKVVYNSGSFSFSIFIVFLVLKLAHAVNWSWWLITLPLWIGPVIFAAIFVALIPFILIALLVWGIMTLFKK